MQAYKRAIDKFVDGCIKGDLQAVKSSGMTDRDNLNNGLFYATQHGHLPVIQYLVDAKANVATRNNQAIWIASKFGRFDIVDYLLEAKADPNNGALQFASENGHLDIVKRLVKAKADVNLDKT